MLRKWNQLRSQLIVRRESRDQFVWPKYILHRFEVIIRRWISLEIVYSRIYFHYQSNSYSRAPSLASEPHFFSGSVSIRKSNWNILYLCAIVANPSILFAFFCRILTWAGKKNSFVFFSKHIRNRDLKSNNSPEHVETGIDIGI